ncbi:MAG: HAMP domain-containing histidine kinase [Ruminococcus flavefaciens]|nr:HAMP domain-containing histidine kinase [Ruminococcus flavefaciens]
MKVIDFLQQKSTRIIAFISACVIFAVCAVCGLNKFYSFQQTFDQYNDVMYYNGFKDEQEELFSELWAVGSMYLRNLDENGKFTGSEELKTSTENALKSLGLMDDKGRITIDSENFDYYVSWGNNSISTDGKSYDDIYKSDVYSTSQINGEFRHDSALGYFNYSGYHWYTTDYGMTYYDFPHTINGIMATAVFDYDTTDLDYYLDDLGVKIYYKKDGSTPVPTPYSDLRNIDMTVYNYHDEYYDGYYEDTEEIQEDIQEVTEADGRPRKTRFVEIPANLLESNPDSYILYDKNSKEWVEVKNDTRNIGNELPLKICVTPSTKILPVIQSVANERKNAEEAITSFMLGAIPFLVVVVFLMGFFVVTSGYNTKKKKFVLSKTDNIWAEAVIATAVLLFFGAVLSVDLLDDFNDFLLDYSKDYRSVSIFMWTTGWTALLALITMCVNSIVKRFKCRSFWKTTLFSRIWKFAWKIIKHIYGKVKSVLKVVRDAGFSRDMADNNIFARRFLIKLGIFILATMFSMAINAEPVVWMIIFAVYIYFSLKDINAVNELSRHISDIYGGDYSPKEVHMDYPTYTLTEKLNNISDGIQTAVDKKLQSEKMKIELVTNVSHDLKTPLTSIISYINLLSMEKDLSPVARDYVKILENKSARLSEIVSDVFDIAKATSRTDINFEMIDAVILMEQVLGDMTDRITDSGKEIRKTVSTENAPVYADGKRLYRVLQNIIDNALKYSLDNTRIYLTLSRTIDTVTIKIKNISSYEIKFTPEEITERFTRGDESRTTEGNGLGLSIAKSFTEACGGTFEITIDGDVFEAIVSLPITTKSYKKTVGHTGSFFV